MAKIVTVAFIESIYAHDFGLSQIDNLCLSFRLRRLSFWQARETSLFAGPPSLCLPNNKREAASSRADEPHDVVD